MYACNGILFNHESPRRGETFVTRKITRALSRVLLGMNKCLHLGNLNALRDWGHAKDYIRMQYLMLQQEKPEDFVIATGRQFSVREFVDRTAKELGITLVFKGTGVDEKGYVEKIDHEKLNSFFKDYPVKCALKEGDCIVSVDERYFRPTEVETLLGDPSYAAKQLGWVPEITFEEMVTEMVHSDMEEALRDAVVENAGFVVSPAEEI